MTWQGAGRGREASLIFLQRMTIRMGPTDAPVLDEKPAHIHLAAWQRARWLAGRYSVLFGNLGAFASIMRRNGAEGIAFFFEIFGRPYSLTIPLRAIAGLLLSFEGCRQGSSFSAHYSFQHLICAVRIPALEILAEWIGVGSRLC